jgi:hypothetical protein
MRRSFLGIALLGSACVVPSFAGASKDQPAEPRVLQLASEEDTFAFFGKDSSANSGDTRVGINYISQKDVTFISVVKSHWAEWTKGSSDGKLGNDRVNAMVNNLKVQGDEACAVATIHRYLRGKNAPKTIDEEFLLDPKHGIGPEEQRDPDSKPPRFQNTFAAYRRHLEIVPRSLFANDAPQRNGLHQGRLEDCWVISGVGQYVTYHPDRVKSMLHEQGDGSYIVSFPHQTIKVPALTDAQIVLGSTAGNQGLWISVLEEAFAIENRSAKGNPAVLIDDLNGGSAVPTIELLTGQKALQIHLSDLREESAKPRTKERIVAEQDLKMILQNLHANKILVTAGTHGKDIKNPPGIPSGHCFGVIDYDPDKKLITLWNPWGNHFSPKGEPGLANGYPTQDGVFTMPLNDFIKVYNTVEGQTASGQSPKLSKK